MEVVDIPPSAPLDTFTMLTHNFPFANSITDSSIVDVLVIQPIISFDLLTSFGNGNNPGTWKSPGGSSDS
jgi:hypothetical protein